MSRAYLVSPHLSDAATITAINEATSLEASNLQILDPTEKWRTTSLSNMYVVLQFPAAVSLDFILALYTNATSNTTWRIRAAASEANLTASPSYDSGNITFWPNGSDLSQFTETHGWKVLTTPQSYVWWRIDFTDATHPDGYFEVGRLMLGKGFSPAIDIPVGWEVTPAREESTLVRSAGGGSVVRQSPRFRDLSFTWTKLTKTEAFGTLAELARQVGMSTDVAAFVDADEATYPMDMMSSGLFRQSLTCSNRGLWDGVMRFMANIDIVGL